MSDKGFGWLYFKIKEMERILEGRDKAMKDEIPKFGEHDPNTYTATKVDDNFTFIDSEEEYYNIKELMNDIIISMETLESRIEIIKQLQQKIEELLQENIKLKWACEPLEHNNIGLLKEVAIRLKQTDGESWAVGEMLERMLQLSFTFKKGEAKEQSNE